jgi:hypothetical protein
MSLVDMLRGDTEGQVDQREKEVNESKNRREGTKEWK